MSKYRPVNKTLIFKIYYVRNPTRYVQINSASALLNAIMCFIILHAIRLIDAMSRNLLKSDTLI